MSKKRQTIKSLTQGLVLLIGLSFLTGCLKTLPKRDAPPSRGVSSRRCSRAAQSKGAHGSGATMHETDAETKDSSTPQKKTCPHAKKGQN